MSNHNIIGKISENYVQQCIEEELSKTFVYYLSVFQLDLGSVTNHERIEKDKFKRVRAISEIELFIKIFFLEMERRELHRWIT